MKKIIEKAISDEAERLAREFHEYHNVLEIECQRNKRRIASPPTKDVKVPEYWSVDKKFNPFYVRKHLKPISRSIVQKLENGTYKPNPPYLYEVKKKGKSRN